MDKDVLIREALRSFRPKFKSLDDDAHNLADHARRLAAAHMTGADELRFPGLALGRGGDFEKLVAFYFEKGRPDLVEAHYKIDEWGRGLPDRQMRSRFHQFAAMGEGARAVRCWQHYIRKNATMFWQDVRDRDVAAKKLKMDNTLQAEFDFHQQSLSTSKRVTLEAIALAMRHFDAFGTGREKEWLDRTRAEVLAEERTRVAAKALPDEMSEALFWSLLTSGGETTEERLDTLPDRLAAYDAKAIKAFGQIVTDRVAEAYREDIWALAYLLMKGCSDDAFDYFRNWLVMQGQEVYAAVLADPDSYDPAKLGETPLIEGLMDAVEQAYIMRSGKEFPRLRLPKSKRVEPDEDAFASLLPRVAERVQ